MDKKLKLNIITQGFYPDYVASGELLYELACELANRYGVDVSVLTAQPGFVIKDRLPEKETVNNVKINRVAITRFDKNSFVGKVLNSWTFFFSALLYSLFSPKADYCLIVTSPPLAPLIGVLLKLVKKQKYIYLMHDVYPEIAWKLGYIKKHGIICKIWQFLTDISLKYADKTVVLSDDMKKAVLKDAKVIHNWSNINMIPESSNRLPDKFDLRDKFIVEYSGNIGRIHEFNTIISAAKELQGQQDIVFLFIGEGGRKAEVERLVKENNLANFKFLPYQQRADLDYSLGMGDIHLISLDRGYESLAAPSKLYGILAAGKPAAFIGSSECYIAKLLEENNCGKSIEIGDYPALKNFILDLKNNSEKFGELSANSRKLFEEKFTLGIICKQYYQLLNL